MASAWRLVKTAHLSTAWNGEGAQRYGGRWNSPGAALVYAAEHLSLACLEVLVHTDVAPVLDAYWAAGVDFGDVAVAEIGGEPPSDWRSDPAPRSTRAIGDAWVAAGATAILRVPSVVVPVEYNYLINLAHPDARRIAAGKPMAFPFDARLKAPRRRPVD
jgi:RES domain-containing protein